MFFLKLVVGCINILKSFPLDTRLLKPSAVGRKSLSINEIYS